jgi:hypothetical protein
VNITLDHTTFQKGVVSQPTRRDPIGRIRYSKKEYGQLDDFSSSYFGFIPTHIAPI